MKTLSNLQRRFRRNAARSRLALYVALVLAVPVSAAAILPAGDVEFVIVTVPELVAPFEDLASFKSDIGIPTRVVTLDWIADNVPPGEDEAATIRGFLQEAHTQWGTAYVLLGGDIGLVPTRWVYNDFFPTSVGTDLPADLYFAGLAGDWDGDDDGIYGEPFESSTDPGDDADLLPDIAVGRAPVGTRAAARLFVDKSIAFHLQSGSIALPSAMLIADVLFPTNFDTEGYVILDGAQSTEAHRALLEASDPPWLCDRFYENNTEYPGAAYAAPGAILDAISSSSYRLVHDVAFVFGDTLVVGTGYISGDQLAQLDNSDPFFFTVLGSNGAAHDLDSAIVRAMLAPEGGSAAGLGMTRASFPSTTPDFFDVFYEHALGVPGARVGDALVAALSAFGDYLEPNYVHRWTQLNLVLLGDPTLPLSATQLPVSIDDRDEGESELPAAFERFGLAAAPNPFNPQVEIQGELPRSANVRLSVCDVRGRVIVVLSDGPQAAGEMTWRWNGTDGSGKAVASGVYLLRLETMGSVVQRAVTLVR